MALMAAAVKPTRVRQLEQRNDEGEPAHRSSHLLHRTRWNSRTLGVAYASERIPQR